MQPHSGDTILTWLEHLIWSANFFIILDFVIEGHTNVHLLASQFCPDHIGFFPKTVSDILKNPYEISIKPAGAVPTPLL